MIKLEMSNETNVPPDSEHAPAEVESKQRESSMCDKDVSSHTHDDVPAKPVFKVPQLIGPRLLKPSKTKRSQIDIAAGPKALQASHIDASDLHLVDPSLPPTSGDDASDRDPKSSDISKDAVDLPYKEPSWSGVPSQNYSFEVLKGGVIVQTIELSSRPYVVCGRLASSDIRLEHPSISRYHAIIQYRAIEDSYHPAGFYLYDLDSTHGTQLNKCAVRPRCYYRLCVGHMIKFGGSSRMFILQGPEEDAEEESSLSVTEIKERRRQEEERLAKIKEAAQAKLEKEDEDEGIDWGMGDDASEEDGYGENPYALDVPVLNEDLYINDPKKTLRGWFEREGYDLEYRIEEKGPGHFLCRVELPLDTPSGEPLRAEASLKGKKKETVVACALEACRILDRYGVLRQANHEGRQRKAKNWEEDDFYDSDEDTYLDQTGTIEKKRMQRKQRAGKEDTKVETYESLLDKHNEVLKEIEKTEMSLRSSNKQAVREIQDDVDSLEAYMVSIKNSTDILDKKAKTRLKIQLSQMKQEELKLRKLLNIAKPASLPSFRPNFQSNKKVSKEQMVERSASSSEREVSDDNPESVSFSIVSEPIKETVTQDRTMLPELGETNKMATTAEDVSNACEDGNQNLAIVQSENGRTATTTDSANVVLGCEPVTTVKRKDLLDQKKTKKLKQKMKYDYNTSDPNYAMWLPPEDQSGDGRTSLNDKFGY